VRIIADLRVAVEEHVLGEEEVGHDEAHEEQQGAQREQQEGGFEEETCVQPVVRPLGSLLAALRVTSRFQLQQQVGARGGALRVAPCHWRRGRPPRLQTHDGASVRQRVPKIITTTHV
jgi:hypothetical protein